MRAGVLLVNLGTPDAPTPRAVRAYLREFLSDRRVVDLPRVLWWPILHGFVLRVRPSEVAHKYRQVWRDDGSPLRAITDAQASALRDALDGDVAVACAMRYGRPPVAAGLRALLDRGVERVLVVPMYPQYSASTTGSVYDAVGAALAHERVVPALRIVRDWHDHPAYIAALAASVREFRTAHGSGDRLLVSFHGVPQRFSALGDPYEAQCRATARLLADELSLATGDWNLTFQSRFGREPWLEPYTDATLRGLAASGVTRVDVVCPGFAADCLETLEEIAIQNREVFQRAGGERLAYIPALNDRPDHIEFLRGLVRSQVSDWLQ